MATNPKLSSSYSLSLDLSLDGGLDLHLADLRGKVEEDWYNSPRPCHDTTSDNSGVAEKERDIPCKPTFDVRADAIKSGGRRANKWTLYDEDERASGFYRAFESLVTPCGKSRLPESHGNLQTETPSRGQGRDETHKFASWLLNDDDLSVGQKRKSEDFIIPPCSPLAQSFRKEGSLRFSAAAPTRLGLSLELDGTRKSSKIGIGPTTSRPSDLLSEISKSGSKKPLFGTRDIDIRPSPSTLQCSDENPSESPFLSDLPPLKTSADAVPQSLVQLSTNTSKTGRSEVNQGGEPGPTGADDLYGLGSFDQVFITDQDLERAREKLPEEEIITPEETMQALLQKLFEAGSGKEESDTENDGKIEPLDPAEEEKTAIFEDIAIGCNWVTLGRGTLHAERATGTLRWTGNLVRIDEVSHSCTNDTDGEPSEGSSKVALLFPGQRLLDVRSKHVEGERPRVIVTVRKDGFPDAFVQFEFPTDQESQTNLCAEIASCRSMDRTEIEAVVRNLRVSDTDELLPDMNDIDEEPAEMSDEETDEEAHREAIREACAQRDARILDAQRECEEQIQKLESDRLCLRYRRRKERRRASRSKGGDGTNLVDDMEISIANCAERSVAETKGSVIIETNVQTNTGVPGECQLCFTDEESQVLVPCGHRVCATCAVKLKEVTTKCPWDRVVYTKIDLIGQ